MSAPMENVLGAVFQSFSLPDDDSDVRLNHLLSVIQSNEILSQQSQTGIQDLISYIHRCLGTSKNRLAGVALLGQVVSQCSTEVFQQSALTWTNLLLQILQGRCQTPVYEASCQILGQIFHFAKNFTDISREIVNSVIPQLVPLLFAASPEVKCAAVSCLNSVIQTYPGPLGPFKARIEASVFSAVDANSDNKEVLQCFGLLPQLGPGGAVGVKHAEAWAGLCQQTLGSLETTLGNLYAGLETDSSKPVERQELTLSPIDPDQSGRVTSLVSRCLCLLACLQELLREGPETAVKMPVEDIIQLVCRCLAVNCKMLVSRPSTERLHLAAHLTAVHVAAWSTLKHLIVTCKSVMLPYHSVIVGLFSQELSWTSAQTTGHTIQYSQLREAVYQVMTVWLKTLAGNSGIHSEGKALVKQILQDCAPTTDSIKLSGQGQESTEVSGRKKKKHRGYQEISQGISSQRKLHRYGNHALVSAGLEALYWMVLTSGCGIDKQALQDVQRFCVRTLLSLQQGVSYPVPYISVECRRNLYRVLHACVVTQHSAVPPPTQCAYGIFRAGLQDKSSEVSSFCFEALKSCEILIHPRAPCLNGPIVCESVIHIHSDLASGTKPSADPGTNGVSHVRETTGPQVTEYGDTVRKSHEQVGAASNTLSSRKRTAERDTAGICQSSVVEVKQARLDVDVDKHADIGELQPVPGSSFTNVTGEVMDKEDGSSDNDDDDDDDDDMNEELGDVKQSDEDGDGVKDIDDGKDETLGNSTDSSEVYVATKLDISVPATQKSGDLGEELEEEGGEEDEETEAAAPVTEGDKDKAGAESDEKDNPEVEAVLMTFVDADPDDD